MLQEKITEALFLRYPKIVKGGHVFFKITSNNHDFWCAVYKPTGMTNIASNLMRGDQISVGGGVRKASKNFPRIINLEFIKIVSLQKNTSNFQILMCKKCKKKMKSKGNRIKDFNVFAVENQSL